MRIIKSMEEKYLLPSLDLIETVFTDYENPVAAKITRNLAAEIRAGRFYDPRLELIMVEDETDEVIGYCMFSRFHLEGKYEDRLLILTPVAVKTALQRQHISKELIDYGLQKAAEYGYTACIVEGNPMNYRSRGFKTSAPYGITAHASIGLPAVDCMMVTELVPGGLEGITGQVRYDDYKSLH